VTLYHTVLLGIDHVSVVGSVDPPVDGDATTAYMSFTRVRIERAKQETTDLQRIARHRMRSELLQELAPDL
jgi:hypothetical protein